MDRDDTCYLQKSGALSVPEKSFRNALLESYIEYVHPYMPVLELHDFINITSQNSEERVSLLLFQAVMFTGSAFVDMAHLISAGFPSRKAARKVLYQKAKVRNFLRLRNRLYLSLTFRYYTSLIVRGIVCLSYSRFFL